MAFCNRCGHENPDGARFCSSCGAEIADEAVAPVYEDGLERDIGTLADPVARLLARMVDGLILFGVSMLFLVLDLITWGPFDGGFNARNFGFGDGFGYFTIIAVLGAVYEFLFIGSRGQTPGKMVMGVKVVTTRGEDPPGWGPALFRSGSSWLMGFVPFLSVVDSLWLLWDRDKQCLHDKAAQTLVVRAR